MRAWFGKFAKAVARGAGSPITFVVTLALIVIWGVTGPLFNYSDSWQLIANTSTTLVTTLMVFLLQHTQNADTEAVQKKLDEVIHAIPAANDNVAGCERKEET